MKYFEISDDLYFPNRWFLGSVNFDGEWDFWKYLKANEELPIPEKKLKVSVREKGTPLDFTMADFELLIVNDKVANLLILDEVQLIPVSIKGFMTKEQFYIIVVKSEYDCVDEELSNFKKWEVDNEIRPDKAGDYEAIYKLVIEERKVRSDIFRVMKYSTKVIISERLKEKFEKAYVTGITYLDVSR